MLAYNQYQYIWKVFVLPIYIQQVYYIYICIVYYTYSVPVVNNCTKVPPNIYAIQYIFYIVFSLNILGVGVLF